MKKYIAILIAIGCSASVATAKRVTFKNLRGSIGNTFSVQVDGAVLTAANSTVTQLANEGNVGVYSFSIVNYDLDGGGVANDAMSWKVKVEGFTNTFWNLSAPSNSSVTLGDGNQQLYLGANEFGIDPAGANVKTLSQGESLKFTVTDLSLTSDLGSVSSQGFDGLWATDGSSVIYGEGTGLPSEIRTANGGLTFDVSGDTLLLTQVAASNERFRDLDGYITVTSETAPVPPFVNPFVDSDGDSYSDAAEMAFGTATNDPASLPDFTPPATPPNLVIIYADDMGFSDISAYGDYCGVTSPVNTPRVDGLVAEGMMFTQAHSSNGVCTPSRYALLTGKYNWREFDGITTHYGGQVGGDELPRASDVTIAEFLKEEGYDTAAFGKWHLGGAFYTTNGTRILYGETDVDLTNPATVDWGRAVDFHAVANGFDSFRGLATSINFAPYVYMEDDRMQIWDASLNGGIGGYRDAVQGDAFHYFTTEELDSTVVGAPGSSNGLGDPSYKQVEVGPQMISQVEAYMADRAQSQDPDPFFAYVSLYSPHKPWAITPAFTNAGSYHYASFLAEVDDRIGRVLDAIDSNGFGSNTVVVFTSDNGPENSAMIDSIQNGRDSNGQFRGNKRDVWEGGTRVPFVVRWPGQAAPGVANDELIWQGDIFATIAAFIGAELPAEVAPDGESFLNILRGQQKPPVRRPSIIISSMYSNLGLKTIDGWKFIDASGGGNINSWDSSNVKLSSSVAEGVNQGVPKQLFNLALDLGENTNLVVNLTDENSIRSNLIAAVGTDLLGELDTYRTQTTAARYLRMADNDADGLPNYFENAYGLNPDSPLDALADSDGDGLNNLQEYALGSNPENSDNTASPAFEIIHDSGTNWFEHIYQRRTDAVDRHLNYQLDALDNLLTNTWSASEIIETGSGPLTTGFEAVTNRIPADDEQKFLRLNISVEEGF
ncbi:sulfatase-like hydrolase/transferase [Pontiellaceae bacterium B12219]|nr:sulfatase-like hydrolase/transferase [Pontiellaceae bacterium B12219]